jgi:hypothetical protein
MNTKQLLELVIRPTLSYIELDSLSAERLILGTCAQESRMGEFIAQEGGCALGIYQIEPATHASVIFQCKSKNPLLYQKVKSLMSMKNQGGIGDQELVTNLAYSTAICRLKYYFIPEGLPAADNISGLASFYKRFYNTPAGAATLDDFISNYNKYVNPFI